MILSSSRSIFAANNSDGDPAIVIAPRKCPVIARGLMGEYRWKMRKGADGEKTSVDGEIDKQNRPFADACDALGYGVMGAGAHAGLIDFARTRPGMLRRNRCGFCQQDSTGSVAARRASSFERRRWHNPRSVHAPRAAKAANMNSARRRCRWRLRRGLWRYPHALKTGLRSGTVSGTLNELGKSKILICCIK